MLDWVKMHTVPSLPILDITRLAIVVPAEALRLEASGWVVPHGKTVAKPSVSGPVIVTLSTTDVALPGTPALPRIFTAVTAPAPTLPPPCCWP